MPKVSLVIPVYNAERHLPACLDSAIGQTLEDIEIVCVNNGSTDGSRDILIAYAGRDDRIILVELKENQGPSGARNAGLDVASGDFVLFFDSDDFLEPTAVEEAHSRCVEDDADIGIFKIRYFYEDKDVAVEADWSLRMDLVPDTVPFSHTDMAGTIFRFVTPAVWNKLFRRSFLVGERLRFSPDLMGAEDLNVTYLALLKAKRITVINKALINFRAGQTNSLGTVIHERPLEICKALALTRQGAIDAGLYEEAELDLVNAALHQCVFTLGRLKTIAAFKELYTALNETYFQELAIDGYPSERFFSKDDYERYLRIKCVPVEVYLFEESRSLRSRLADCAGETRVLRTRLKASFSDVNALRGELGATRSKLMSTAADLRDRNSTLGRIQRSRSYRIAQGVGRISRKITGFLPSRKAE